MSTGDEAMGGRHAVEQRMAARSLFATQAAVSIAALIAQAATDTRDSELAALNSAVEQLEELAPVVASFADLPPGLLRPGQVTAGEVDLLIRQLRAIISHET